MSRYFHWVSQSCPILSAHTFCKSAGIIYVCFVYFAAISQVRINLQRQKVFFIFFYFIQWCCEKGAKSYVAKKISGRERRSRDETGNQGVEDFRFTIILQLFFNYFTLIIIFFLYFFLPTTFIHTHIHTHLFTPTTQDLHPLPSILSWPVVRAKSGKEWARERGSWVWAVVVAVGKCCG